MSTAVPASDEQRATRLSQSPRLLSTAETADYLGLTREEMERMRVENEGPCYIRLGGAGIGKVFYELEDVQAWADLRASNAIG